jgi:YbbR domain-containing protein
MTLLRWLGRNLSTIVLALVLAVAVWVSAVLAADPNQEGVYARTVPVELRNQDPDLIIVNQPASQVRLTLNAPRSIWDKLNANPNYVKAWIDLNGLEPGEHLVNVETSISLSPSRVVQVEPEEATVVLEPLVSRTIDVNTVVTGDPALGYRKDAAYSNPSEVTISGPESLVSRVSEVRASMDIAGASQTVQRNIALQPMDESGNPVQGISISPQQVQVSQPVSLLGGSRNVVVKVVTTGQVAEGYWLTNISVTPPNVTVFSTNPELVNDLPGWVETMPLELNGLSDDIDVRAELNLPEGVTMVGEESVLVRVGVAALEGNLTMTLVPEIVGLPPDLLAEFSPETIDVILSGPLPLLYNLTPAAVRVTLDLTGLEPGGYQITPVVDLLPEGIEVVSLQPAAVQVTITVAPTPTPTGITTPTPILSPTAKPTATPTLTPTPTPTIRPTARPTLVRTDGP